jgi:hypothetical protein
VTRWADHLLPTLDHAAATRTGWTRRTWEECADRLVLAARHHGTPDHAGIVLPGAVGGYGARVDALEGYARTLLAVGFRVAGARGADPHDHLGWYAAGLAVGTDPASPHRWVRLDEDPQAKVEGASLALVLHLTRPWLWDGLAPRVQEQVVDYLAPAVGGFYPDNNWLWFRAVTQTFLASVGGPHRPDEVAASLELAERCHVGHGWSSDGVGRTFDHYSGWAMQLYPLLWAGMAAAQPAAAGTDPGGLARLRRRYAERAVAYAGDAVRLIGADGGPLLQGRSLTYRFATVAPLWSGVMGRDVLDEAAEDDSGPSLGALRHAAAATVRHFLDAGAPGPDGVLDLGWRRPWPGIAQSYSGPGSPYWATKAFAGLLLPAEHPLWAAPEEPLPAEGDQAFVLPAPGWLVTSRAVDGVVRVTNHGTTTAPAGSTLPESPLYERLTYTTATSPRHDPLADPLEDAVVLLDAGGRASSRAGLMPEGVGVLPTGTLRGASRWRAHWATRDAGEPDHGRARTGSGPVGPALRVVSLVRGAWEVRLVHVAGPADPGTGHPGAGRLRVGGTAVPADHEPEVSGGPGRVAVAGRATDAGRATGRSLACTVVDLGGLRLPGHRRLLDATPLAAATLVGWLVSDGPADGWYAAAVRLGAPDPDDSPPSVTWDAGRPDRVSWADGTVDRAPAGA